MPKLTAETKRAVYRAIIDWAIRDYFALLVTDPLPDADELTDQDVCGILERIGTVQTMDDFYKLAHAR